MLEFQQKMGGEGAGVMGGLVMPALHFIRLAHLLPIFQRFQLEKYKGMERATLNKKSHEKLPLSTDFPRYARQRPGLVDSMERA